MRGNPQPLALSANDSAILASFERHLLAEGKSPHTLKHYLGATRHFMSYANAEGINTLTAKRDDIEGWLLSLRPKMAPASVRSRFLGLQAFYRWCLEEEEIPRNPTARMKKPAVEETRKDVAPPELIEKALKSLEKTKRWRDCMIVAVLYDTGMRAGELVSVRLEHIDLTAGTIVIVRSKNKTMRMVHLSPQAVRYVDRYLRRRKQQGDWLVLGERGKMTPNGLYQVVVSIFKAMGSPVKIGPHDLRHTSASHVVGTMSEAALMQLYGWKDADMARHYARQALEQAAIDEHKRASPLGKLMGG